MATDRKRPPAEVEVAIVGGGPAGMEAALRLSQRGHPVTLLEATDRLGGTLAFAGIAYPANLRLLADMLAEQGYKVRSVVSGQMALTATRAAPPDLTVDQLTSERVLAPPVGIDRHDVGVTHPEQRRAIPAVTARTRIAGHCGRDRRGETAVVGAAGLQVGQRQVDLGLDDPAAFDASIIVAALSLLVLALRPAFRD